MSYEILVADKVNYGKVGLVSISKNMFKMFSFDWKFGLDSIQLFSVGFLLCNRTDDIIGTFFSLKISDSA
jgi:hypothetical protein